MGTESIWTTIATTILMMTCLSLSGMLSACAVLLSKRWYVGAAFYLAALSLLLLIPAFEPFVAFSFQGAVVAAGIQGSRWGSESKGIAVWRNRSLFSIQTGLLLTALFAIGIAVFVRLPVLGFDAWWNVVLIGLSSGLATLLGLWMTGGQRFRFWLRFAIGLTACLLISFLLAYCDSFLISWLDLYSSWPPGDQEWKLMFGVSNDLFQTLVPWIGVVVGMAIIQAVIYWWTVELLGFAIGDGVTSFRWSDFRQQPFASVLLFVSLGLIAALPAVVYYRLMTPQPIPQEPKAGINGWNDIVAAGRIAEHSRVSDTISNYDIASQKELTKAVGVMSNVYSQVELAMQEPVMVPVDYTTEDIDVDSATGCRQLTRAMAARGRLAELDGRFEEAAQSHLQVIRFGFAIRKKGLMIQSIVGTACSGVGRSLLYRCRENLSSDQCLTLISSLAQIEKQAEPASGFVGRDRTWSQHAFGWHGHLSLLLEELTVPASELTSAAFLNACKREATEMQLLKTELAIQAWRVEHNAFPNSLDALVPNYLTAVPLDPMAALEVTLHYQKSESEYILYSVGFNGVDDGGDPPMEEYGFESGDLSLEILCK